MASGENNLPDFFAGMPLDHNDPQAIVDALRALQRYVGNITTQGGPKSQIFNGVQIVVETFPAHVQAASYRSTGYGDATFTDCRYYFKRILFDPTIKTNAVLLSADEPHTAWILTGVATNLAELPPNNTGSGSHSIQDNTIVQVFSAYLRSATQKKIYWFNHVPLDGVTMRVALAQTGGTAGSVSAFCSFTYTAKYIGTSTVIGTSMSPEASLARAFKCTATAATMGLVYWTNGTPILTLAYETTGNKSCT